MAVASAIVAAYGGSARLCVTAAMVAALASCSASRVTFATLCPVPPGPQIPPVGDWLPNAMTGTATRTRQVSPNATTAAITDLID